MDPTPWGANDLFSDHLTHDDTETIHIDIIVRRPIPIPFSFHARDLERFSKPYPLHDPYSYKQCFFVPRKDKYPPILIRKVK